MKARQLLRILILLLILSIDLLATAQTQKFSHYSVKDGLSQSTIICFFQDSDGYLWIGTQNGLNKFNGYSFDNFFHNPTDKNSISNNWILSITEDKLGNLWIGTQKGLNKFDKKNETFSVLEHLHDNSLIDNSSVPGLSTDKNGNILINTPPELHILNPETNEIKHYANSLPVELVVSDHNMPVIQVSDGLIWIASTKGLARFDTTTEKFVNFTHLAVNSNTISDNNITALYEDKKNNIWIGTQNGLNRYNKKARSFIHYTNQAENINSLSSNSITAIIEDNNRNLWLGTASEGLNKMNFHANGNVKSCLRFHSQSGNSDAIVNDGINSLFIDRSDNLWVGITGIDKTDLKRKKFRLYRNSADDNSILLSNNAIFPIIEYEKDILWLGTRGNGLNIYNRKTGEMKYYLEKEKGNRHISNNFLNSMMKDKKGRVWVGTRNGIDIYDPQNQVFTNINDYFPKNDFLSFSEVWTYSIIEDRNGNIIVSTAAGLHILDMQALTSKSFTAGGNIDSSLSANNIYSVIEDRDGDIWIATSNGLDQYIPDKNIFKHYRNEPDNPNSICRNFVISLCQDSRGYIWIGTNSAVNRFNKKTSTFEYFEAKDDFPSSAVYDIIEDNNKNMWFTTGAGLLRYDYITGKFTTFNEEDGLQSLEYNLKACYKANDGEIFVGGINGFNSFYPDSLFRYTFVPQVVITSFVKENDSGKHKVLLSKNEEIVLTHLDYAVAIEFASLDFTNPKENQYAYKMEGLTDKRIENGNSRVIQFLNLPQGSYVLTVFGTNNEGRWNKEGTSIKIRVLPPWWKSKLAYLSYIILIIITIVILVKLRERKHAREKKVLEINVLKRTAELQEANTLLEERQEEIIKTNNEIITQKELVDEKNSEIEKAYKQSQIISEFGQKITSTLNINDINEMVYAYINSLMSVAAFGIGLYNKSFNRIDFHNFYENKKIIKLFTKSLDDENSLTAYTMNNKKVVFIRDIEKEYSKYIPQLPEVKTSQRALSIIHIPLIAETRIIGIIIMHCFKRNAYDERDLNILQTLASYITIALDNANAYKIVNDQHINITDSIEYALSIQQSMLPQHQDIQKIFDNFLLYYPKDIVSGDFYWHTKVVEPVHKQFRERHFFAVVDCTGHGVPGAFMSLIGNRLLTEVVIQRKIYSPKIILEKINKYLQKTLNQYNTHNDDGMEICLCMIEKSDNKKYHVVFSGAKRPLIYFDSIENEIKQIKGDLKGIGGLYTKLEMERTNHELELTKGDILYLTTDGYVDQSDINRNRFTNKKLTELLKKIAKEDMSEQNYLLDTNLHEHQGYSKQRDDITIWGLKL